MTLSERPTSTPNLRIVILLAADRQSLDGISHCSMVTFPSIRKRNRYLSPISSTVTGPLASVIVPVYFPGPTLCIFQRRSLGGCPWSSIRWSRIRVPSAVISPLPMARLRKGFFIAILTVPTLSVLPWKNRSGSSLSAARDGDAAMLNAKNTAAGRTLINTGPLRLKVWMQ